MDNQEETNDINLAETLEETPISPIESPQVAEEAASQPDPAPVAESTANLRFKTIREAREKAEQERDALAARITKMEAANRPQTQAPKAQDYAIDPDDYVEGKHLAKYDRDIQALKQQVEGYQQHAAAMGVENKLNAEYPDFNSVVTKENLDMLRKAYPPIGVVIDSSPDLYSKASSAYTMIKQFGFATDPAIEKQRVMAEGNVAKPRPLASVNPQQGAGALSRANEFAQGLTKERKAELNREMRECAKRRGQ